MLLAQSRDVTPRNLSKLTAQKKAQAGSSSACYRVHNQTFRIKTLQKEICCDVRGLPAVQDAGPA